MNSAVLEIPQLVFEGSARELRLLMWYARQRTGAVLDSRIVNGKHHVHIQGGEPLVWRTIDVIQERLREGNTQLNLVSGGLPR